MELNRETVLKYLGKQTRADVSAVTDKTELFSTGLIDSYVMVDLMFWLQRETGISIDPDDFIIDNIDTIERMLAFVGEQKSKKKRR